MKNKKKHVLKYSFLVIILIGIFISIYLPINTLTYRNREPKTFILNNDLFQNDFSYNLESDFQMENVIRLNLPWSLWNLRDFNFINNSSFVFTLKQSSGSGDKSNVMNQLNIDSNQNYDVNELAYMVTSPIVTPDGKTLLFSPIDNNGTHIFDIEKKEITNTLDDTVYNILSDRKQYLLISDGMLIMQDMNTNKRQSLISIEKLEQILYEDYINNIKSNAQLPLEERFYDIELIVDFHGYERQVEYILEEVLQEQYEDSGYEWPMDDSNSEGISFFPFMYLNPWNFQTSTDESKIYFKVDFGPSISTLYSLDIDTKQVNKLLEGNIVDFTPVDNDKLIIQGSLGAHEGLFLYNIQSNLTEQIINTDVQLFDISSDGKLAYITTNTSGTNELRVAYYDGKELKGDNIVYISSEYIDFLQWSPSGEELFFIRDNIGTSELLMFKIKNN